MPSTTLMTPKEVAELIGCHEVTLRRWRLEGKGPPFIQIVGTVKYRKEDIEEWLEKNTTRPGEAI